MMTNLRNILSTIAFFCLVVFLVYKCSTGGTSKEDILKLDGRTIGTVIYKGGTKLEMEYEIDGLKYILKKSRPYTSIQNGEQFQIAYNPHNKNDAIPIYYEPVINEGIFETTNSLGDINWDINNYFTNQQIIGFDYKVNGIEYHKAQVIEFGTEKGDIILDRLYPVMYNVKNPKIAYILLDK
ncbi:hypothetical protein [Chondrinema litorale]|uniref:hypothetical protein n=1 Tax=Chondrinema litorale TaxID=2994555 RepID=UPI002542FC65|nr:hypothetical protein [Chondrinema litorale]UZR99101.1 hypothetical protein OQ292_35110 [Chondrinema litorale]